MVRMVRCGKMKHEGGSEKLRFEINRVLRNL